MLDHFKARFFCYIINSVTECFGGFFALLVSKRYFFIKMLCAIVPGINLACCARFNGMAERQIVTAYCAYCLNLIPGILEYLILKKYMLKVSYISELFYIAVTLIFKYFIISIKTGVLKNTQK